MSRDIFIAWQAWLLGWPGAWMISASVTLFIWVALEVYWRTQDAGRCLCVTTGGGVAVVIGILAGPLIVIVLAGALGAVCLLVFTLWPIGIVALLFYFVGSEQKSKYASRVLWRSSKE